MEELNVVLREKMDLFFQTLRRSQADGQITEDEREELQKKEAQMLQEILRGVYLVPARMQQNMPPEFGILTSGNPIVEWFPAFTNMVELQKLFDPNQWTILSLNYDQVIREAGARGVVVDPAGYNFRITQQNKGMIESFRENLSTQKEAPKSQDVPVEQSMPVEQSAPAEPSAPVEQSAPAEQNASVTQQVPVFFAPIDPSAHFAPANCPPQIIQALSNTMGRIPQVRRAYMVSMNSQGQSCFLAVVDTLGDQNAILEQIYQSVAPYLNGLPLKMHGSDIWGLSAVKGIKPFYKKSFF